MPLRDHFRPPFSNRTSWEGFHGMWPGMIVQHLEKFLPDDYTAEPRVHLGSYFEIDVSAFEGDEPRPRGQVSSQESADAATATWSPPQPTLTIDAELPDQYEYEVLVFDHSRGRQLVAAVELVSPANKDRLANRRAFVAKCATLLQQNVCLSIVDLVTTRRFNLYTELFELIDRSYPVFSPDLPRRTLSPVAGAKFAKSHGSNRGPTRSPSVSPSRHYRCGCPRTSQSH